MKWNRPTSRRLFLAAAAASAARVALPQSNSEIVLRYVFNEGSHGWLSSFSDYSLEVADLQRIAELRPFPPEIAPGWRAFYLQSMNRSDDVFMFLKKQLGSEEGLRPNQLYSVSIDTVFASEAQSGCVGIGGAPGESVYFKAGVSNVEPVPTLMNMSYVGLNVDKGGQSNGGKDAGVVGNIANGTPCDLDNQRFVLMNRLYHHPVLFRTGLSASMWVFVGTDSGFEGLTRLYYHQVIITLRPVGG